MGSIGMSSPKEYGFSAVLVIHRVWFLHSSLELDIDLSRLCSATFGQLSALGAACCGSSNFTGEKPSVFYTRYVLLY